MPRASTPETTRGRRRRFDEQQAIETAMDLFWQHGYEATSVSQLCVAIGINPPSLYAAFGSKAQLFLDVVDYYERTFWDPVWDAFEREPQAQSAFRGLFNDTIDVISAPGTRLGCLVTLSSVGLDDRDTDVARALAAIGQQTVRRTQAKLESAIRSGQIPAGTDTLALAHAVSAVIDGLAIRAHDGVPPDMLRRLATAGMQMIPAGA